VLRDHRKRNVWCCFGAETQTFRMGVGATQKRVRKERKEATKKNSVPSKPQGGGETSLPTFKPAHQEARDKEAVLDDG